MLQRIKPCPFCRAPGKLTSGLYNVTVYCPACNARGPDGKPEYQGRPATSEHAKMLAIKRWEKRAIARWNRAT